MGSKGSVHLRKKKRSIEFMQPTSCKLNVLGVKKVFFSTDGKRRDMAERS